MIVFFFFQAEDGIRDIGVTGVQTCALPIFVDIGDVLHDVHYVQNVTDVDDPLFERADRDGEDWIVLGMRETALFREDMEALRVLPPKDYIGAVESIPSIVDKVVSLLDAGVAYQLDDGTGDLYFDLSHAPRFGSESHYTRDTMLRL